MMALQASHPPPSDTGPYYDFGFCVCNDEHSESALGGLYQRLLLSDKLQRFWTRRLNLSQHNYNTCTFTEFWRAFEARKLIDLVDTNGLKSERQRFRHLDQFLGYSPGVTPPPVWKLQAFLDDKNATNAPELVLTNYGFMNCNGYFEIVELKKVYEGVLERVDPLALHDACVKGRLFEFTKEHVHVEPHLRRIMRNLYPFPIHERD